MRIAESEKIKKTFAFNVDIFKGSRKIKKYLQQLEDYDKLTNGLYERGLLL